MTLLNGYFAGMSVALLGWGTWMAVSPSTYLAQFAATGLVAGLVPNTTTLAIRYLGVSLAAHGLINGYASRGSNKITQPRRDLVKVNLAHCTVALVLGVQAARSGSYKSTVWVMPAVIGVELLASLYMWLTEL